MVIYYNRALFFFTFHNLQKKSCMSHKISAEALLPFTYIMLFVYLRRSLHITLNAILLYSTEVWLGAVRFEVSSKQELVDQRVVALRIVCAYCTVSCLVVMVLAEVIIIDLLAVERMAIFFFFFLSSFSLWSNRGK